MMKSLKSMLVRASLHPSIRNCISTQKMQDFPVEEYEVGERLDRYLKKSKIGWISGQKHLRKKQVVICKMDGTILNKRDYRLEKGDILKVSKFLIDRFAKTDTNTNNQLSREQATKILNKMTLFDNENITILNKKNGYSVQGGPHYLTNLFSLMCCRYKKQLIHITHRLDKGTSGLVLFSKNKQTAQLVQIAMEQRNYISKFYIAQTQGLTPITKQGYIRSNIQWSTRNKARICNQLQSTSKDCITFYLPILSQRVNNQNQKQMERYRNLLGIKLITGRKHQIRCHLSSYLQQPIVNDMKYRGTIINRDQDDQKIHLHAVGLMIKKRQIVDKILAGPSQIVNNQLGELFVNQKQNSVLFIAKLPDFWEFQDKNTLQLKKLCMVIEGKEKQNEKMKPKVRNMSQIL